MIDFIGIGAQKAGTSWVHACLYEHPEICSPVKEIHFFSRSRFSKGKKWYEAHFDRCAEGKKTGEFSTSYLFDPETPARIKELFPDVKLIAILRNPVERAVSQYKNAIKAAEILPETSFAEYIQSEASAIQQGLYFQQIQKYLQYFDTSKILFLIYEDSLKNPQDFIKSIYSFLEVDADFRSSQLHEIVNPPRIPKYRLVDKSMHRIGEWLRRHGLDRFVWLIVKSGAIKKIHNLNSKSRPLLISKEATSELATVFRDDAAKLGQLLKRDLVKEWKL